ncbi:MAG TPA: PEP-utilizing enzyme [Saprospiraceae bacterium]|nr:PEP-utilizing enzyme [Saprospiraceae bacterium]
MQVFIFGAAKGADFNDSSKNQHFLNTLVKGKRVLDWTLHGLYQAGFKSRDINFIGGYNIESIIKAYPDISYVINPQWMNTHVVGSLRYAMQVWKGGDILIMFADTVFRPKVFSRILLEKNEIIAGIDTDWKSRVVSNHLRQLAEKVILSENIIIKAGRQSINIEEASAQFSGLVAFSSEMAEKLQKLFSNGSDTSPRPLSDNDSITDLMGYILRNWNVPITSFEIAGQWAELDSPSDLARFVFGTKAETLERIKPFVKKSIICDQIHFRLNDWEKDSEKIIHEIQSQFQNEKLIIRSSSLEEDSWESSQAGAFLSIADVPAGDRPKLQDAITRVIHAFCENGTGNYNPKNQVLVQPFISNVAMSGVAFSKQLEKRTPYYLINYDDTSGKTDTVTSGSLSSSKSVTIYQNAKSKPGDKRIYRVTQAIKELKKITGYDSLDVEFVMTKNNDLFIVQVRPITLHSGLNEIRDFDERLKSVKKVVKSRLKRYPHIFGETTVLADMPDWNPAEMISIRPNPLALSLYTYLITHRVWREARAMIGYHNPAPERLLFCIAGHPYIDVRNSFNNLIPAGLPKSLADKLVTHYIQRLKDNPHFHDKVEFEIAITCYTPDIDHHIRRLADAGFTGSEINALKNALRKLTSDAITGKHHSIDSLIKLTESLEPRNRKLRAKNHKAREIPGLIQFLLDDCIERGTIPFSILARYGFIASSILRGLVNKKVITEEEKNAFMNSIETIAGQLVDSMNEVLNGKLSLEDFLVKFGHLRPGSYDITSYSYNEKPYYYFPERELKQNGKSHESKSSRSEYSFSNTSRKRIRQEIKDMGLDVSVNTLLNFIRKATAAREYAKFQFTKNLDKVLKLIHIWGEAYGFSRNDMQYLFIDDILQLATITVPLDMSIYIKQKVQEGQLWYEESHKIETPQMISSIGDLEVIVHNTAQPNFVTEKNITAPICLLNKNVQKDDLKGKIVVIEGADPGYDWIFMHSIKGLITKYGGAASHMTIRCAEFGLPAAIGCGEEMYEKLLWAQNVELNCTNKQIRILG